MSHGVKSEEIVFPDVELISKILKPGLKEYFMQTQ